MEFLFFGGGMRSVAYAGSLKALEEFEIKPMALAGSSGGALVSAPYAYGKTPLEIFTHFKTFKAIHLLSPYSIIFRKSLNYSAWERHFEKLIPVSERIEQTKIKLFIHTTNIKKQESEWLEKGSILKSVIASSAFFGSYSINGKKYADGDYDPETGVQKTKRLWMQKNNIRSYNNTKGTGNI